MKEFKIVEITPAEHREWCEQQIKEMGLLGAVREQLNEIVGLCRAMNYSGFGEVVERAQNVTDLIEAFGHQFGVYRVDDSEVHRYD